MPSTCASLSLSGVDFGEFGGARVPADGVTETTVEAEAAQGRASISIAPPDTDQSAAGHQVALGDVPEVTVTVTSPDGRRERGGRVLIGQPEAAAPCPGGSVRDRPGVPARRRRPQPQTGGAIGTVTQAAATSALADQTTLMEAWPLTTAPSSRRTFGDTRAAKGSRTYETRVPAKRTGSVTSLSVG